MKNAMTVLLAVDEDISESQLSAINKALSSYKELGDGTYKMVNWVTYHGRSGRTGSDDDDFDDGEDFDPVISVAENYMHRPREAIDKRRR